MYVYSVCVWWRWALGVDVFGFGIEVWQDGMKCRVSCRLLDENKHISKGKINI
jgi:hypothetical protein